MVGHGDRSRHTSRAVAPSRTDDVTAVWCRATLDASGGYMVWRAVREGAEIVDFVVMDANALAIQSWSDTVGTVIGARASQMNVVADNSGVLDVLRGALERSEQQTFDVPLALPGGRGGWRRMVATPLDADTVSVVTRDISRERYLERALERERREQRSVEHPGSQPQVQFAARTAAMLFVGSGLVAFLNGAVSRLPGVDTRALQMTGLSCLLIAAVVLVLPWKRHFTAVANSIVVLTLAFLFVTDAVNHYSRTESALAVYPVFVIILIAWTGLTRPAFMSALAALASAPVLYGIFSRGGHASAGWECLIVTIPVAAALGEILSWSMRRARKMTHLEAQRRLHDALTGAGNRTLLSVQLDHALARVRRSHKALALLQVNLDDFKSVNETMGTFAGDDVLVETAARLRASIRETDTIARIGADEFVVLCEDIDALHFATTIARRILDALSLPFTVESDSVRLTASIGIAFSSDGTETVDTLLQNAGLALYQAKHSGRGRYEVFGEAIRDQIAKRRELEAALARAVSRQELRLHYQPIVESESARVESFEALLRWERPGLGVIPPGDFIPLAEQTGLIVDIGAWVVQEACRQAASWGNERLRSKVGVTVNVASRQLVDGDFVAVVQCALSESGLEPRLLTVEITESTLIEDTIAVKPLLEDLRALGVNLALDDFGTGYSSLTYLRTFPINVVKIDRSFVRTIGTDREDTTIVGAVIALAKQLGLHVVAEGVETDQQHALLRKLGCPYLQGFLFSRPRPASELGDLLRPATPDATESVLDRT